MEMLGTLPDMCPMQRAICSMGMPLSARLVAKERRPVCEETNSHLCPLCVRPARKTLVMVSIPHARQMSRMLSL